MSDADESVATPEDFEGTAWRRLAVLGAVDEPKTAAEISKQTGIPYRTVHLSLEKLEEWGLVNLVSNRPRPSGGMPEDVYARTVDRVEFPGKARQSEGNREASNR